MRPLRLRNFLILLLVLTGLLTFSLVGSGLLAFRLPQVADESRVQAHEAAQRVSGLLSNTLTGLENELVTLARVLKSVDLNSARRIFGQIDNAHGRFGAIYMVSREGRLIAAEIPEEEEANPALIGSDLSNNDLFQLALVSPNPIWSDRYLSVVTGRVTVGLGVLVGEWVLMAELPDNSLQELAQEWIGLVDQTLLVVDDRGEWLIDNRPDLKLNTTNWWAHPVLEAPRLGRDSPDVVNLGKGRFYTDYHVSEELRWNVIAAVPAGMDNPHYARVVYLVALGFIGSTTIGFLFAPFWARSIVKPVTRLVELSREVAAGNYEVKWPRGRLTELNRLSDDLRSMVMAIQERERSLAESTERLNATVDNAPMVATQWFDEDGRVVFWNKASTLCFGYDESESVGKTLDQLIFTPNQQREFVALIRNIFKDGKPFGPTVFQVRDKWGRERHIMSSVFAIPGEQGRPYAVCTDIDITERVLAEEALEANQKKLKILLDMAPTAMLIARDMRAIEVNVAWEKLFGYRRGEILGKNGEEMGWWESMEDRNRFVETVLSEKEVDQFQAWFKDREGNRFLSSVSVRQVEVSHDEGELSIIIYEDITENYNFQHELSMLNQELEQRVEERTQDLQRSNQELASALDVLHQAQDGLVQAEKHAALGRLVAGVAHELNTPIGNSSMAMSTLADHLSEFKKEIKSGLKKSTFERFMEDVEMAAEITLRNLHRSSELVSTFKQVAADRESSVRREFDLREIVDEVLIVLQPTLKRLPFRIRSLVEPGIKMDSYPGPLGQVLTNLINNSVIHGLEGRKEGSVKIAAELAGDSVLLQVTDDGKGMDEESAARAFDPFFTTRQGQGGTGLGLHVLHNLVVQVLGGSVELTTEPGVGTTFKILIPLIAPAVTKLEDTVG